MKKIEVAVILGAGFGKRLSPITNKIPKPLIEIGNETILDKTIKLIRKLNLKKILINSHYKRDQLKDCLLYTSPSPRDVRSSRMPSSA